MSKRKLVPSSNSGMSKLNGTESYPEPKFKKTTRVDIFDADYIFLRTFEQFSFNFMAKFHIKTSKTSKKNKKRNLILMLTR
jgi:hypothetical protein